METIPRKDANFNVAQETISTTAGENGQLSSNKAKRIHGEILLTVFKTNTTNIIINNFKTIFAYGEIKE